MHEEVEFALIFMLTPVLDIVGENSDSILGEKRFATFMDFPTGIIPIMAITSELLYTY